MLVLTSQVKFCKTIDKNPLWWFLTLWSSWKTITLHLLFFFVQDKFNFTDCRTLVHWFLVFLKVGELTCDSDILLWIKNMLRKRHYLFKIVCKFEVYIYWAWIIFLMSMLCVCKMKCKMSCLTLEFFFFQLLYNCETEKSTGFCGFISGGSSSLHIFVSGYYYVQDVIHLIELDCLVFEELGICQIFRTFWNIPSGYLY